MASIEFLNLNTWDGLYPVLLPLGQKSMPAVGAASIGVVIPLSIFVVALFNFFYRICDCNAKSDSGGSSSSSSGDGSSRIITLNPPQADVPSQAWYGGGGAVDSSAAEAAAAFAILRSSSINQEQQYNGPRRMAGFQF